MDSNAFAIAPLLIEGGAQGLDAIAGALRERSIPVDGVYLMRLVYNDGGSEWVIRIVSSIPDQRKILFPLYQLQDQGRLPKVHERVRFSVLRPDHPEASRMMSYAHRVPQRPLELEGAGVDGIYVDYALIGHSIPAAA